MTTTIVGDHMQRAPAFLFESAREARDFGEWLDEHFDEIREAAESTTSSGKLQEIERYSAGRILYTRFNYTTGDAAGQNLTGKATQAACHWIVEQYPDDRAVLPRVQLRDRQEDLADQHAAHARQAGHRRGDDPQRPVPAVMRSSPSSCTGPARSPTSAASCPASTTTAPTPPTASPRCSSPPARTPPTSPSPPPRSSTPSCATNGDYYYSITIPSLIVATYGGGTGLATQRECLEMLGCYGTGKVAQVRRDRRRDGAVRRAVARLGDRRRGVGRRPRPVRPQPAVTPQRSET